MKFKVNDTVQVTAGKDKGRKGKVIKVIPRLNQVTVEGLNMYKRHRKAAMGKAGEMVDKLRPLGLGKVALICPKCGKVTRVGYEVNAKLKIKNEKLNITKDQENKKTGKHKNVSSKFAKFQKVRICRKCSESIDI